MGRGFDGFWHLVYGSHPQLLHHRAHRPRQIDAGGPPHRAYRWPIVAGDGRPGAGFHGPRARARHHDQGPDRGPALHRARRPRVRAEPHRYARPRGFLLRGVALALGVRGRAAGRRCFPGSRGADGGQLLHRDRARRGSRPGAEQDRPAVGAARSRDPGNRGRDRHRRHRRGACQREDGRGRGRRDRGGDRAHPAAQGRPFSSA